MRIATRSTLALSIAAVLAAVAGCASAPATKPAADASGVTTCLNQPKLGSLMMRREACVAATEEEREAARENLERMRQDQERAINSRRSAGG